MVAKIIEWCAEHGKAVGLLEHGDFKCTLGCFSAEEYSLVVSR